MSSLFNLDDCKSAVGRKFTAVPHELECSSVEIELRTVTEHDVPSQFECYSLLFKGAAAHPLEQGTYTLSSESFPGDEVFLTPIFPGEAAITYEAVFNTVRKSAADAVDLVQELK